MSLHEILPQQDGRPAEEIIQKALASVRTHLGMEIAYLSEIIDETSHFRAVDAPGLEHLIKPGDSRALDEVYCSHIIEGRLPRLIPDTGKNAFAAAMPITSATPIGSHVSIPIRRTTGEVYGMFCCLSPTPNPGLNDRDLAIMEVFADLCADQINGALSLKHVTETRLAMIQDILTGADFDIVYQPIYHLDDARPCGFEALCRFKSTPYRSPDIWFAEAASVGLGVDLELAVIASALQALNHLPDDIYLSVNASPSTVMSGRLGAVLDGWPLARIALEITEHEAIGDMETLLTELQDCRDRGLILAIDDAGAGYSGLQQIVRLAPDVLKLDMSLTSGIDSDPPKRSLAAAMVHFATEQGSVIIAEGIETEAELMTLRTVGVHRGQGYFLGKPVPLDAALALVTGRTDPATICAE